MSEPQTLVQMAGATPSPPPLGEAALVLIDCQGEYVDGRLALPGVAAALDEAARLLALARRVGMPVLHIRHRGKPGGLFDPETPRFQVDARVAPADGEAVIDKGLPNAFAGTDLHAQLQTSGRSRLVLAGFMTHMCVSSTARAALDLGYASTVVADACATRDLPDGRGGVVPAAALHRAELAALADRFATILPDTAALQG